MKSKKLFNAIGGIDDKYIAEAQPGKAVRSKFIKNLVKIAACLLVVGIGIFSVPYFLYNENAENSKTNDFTFIVTAYAATESGSALTVNYLSETVATELKPNVEVNLPFYTPVMSSVPGFPFIITTSDETLKTSVQVDNGRLLKWDRKIGIVTDLKTVTLENGETIYWSPFDESFENKVADKATITVTATDGLKNYGTQTINIVSDGLHYKASAGDMKTE